jgi:hypothetical protein
MFEEAARRSVSRDNVVKASRTRADYAPRTYLLRSFLRCGACGLPMHGRERHGVTYYVCETTRRQTTLVAPEHPKMIYVREDRAVARVMEFLQTHLFGPGRREGLARALEETDPERDSHHDEAERLKSELAELAVRIRRQVSHLEALEADTDAGAEIRSRLRELTALKARRERELEAAERSPGDEAPIANRPRSSSTCCRSWTSTSRSSRRSRPGAARCSRLPSHLRASSKRAEGAGDACFGAPARERRRHRRECSTPFPKPCVLCGDPVGGRGGA